MPPNHSTGKPATVNDALRGASRRYYSMPALDRPANISDVLNAREASLLARCGCYPIGAADLAPAHDVRADVRRLLRRLVRREVRLAIAAAVEVMRAET
jgi:hypothetical protein